MDKQLPEAFRKKYEFQWDIQDIIIGGRSAIDFWRGFDIRTLQEADQFILRYGYNLSNPIERAEIFGNFHESLNFIRKYFLQPENPEGLKLEIPRRILELTDIRELLLMADFSLAGQNRDTYGQLLRNWACAILKVMHTVAHIDQDLRSSYFQDIQQQIFDNYYRVVHRDSSDSQGSNDQLYLGDGPDDPQRVDLVAFETKPKKSRNSILLKLLHKPENVAEDIFDRIGLRFITKTRLDALRVVKFLRDKMIIMPPNIKPSRSRNTLVDIDVFEERLEEFLEQVKSGVLTEAEMEAELEASLRTPMTNPENPHSSEYYRALQFTCRQLIKFGNPLFDELRKLKALVRAKPIQENVLKFVEFDDFRVTRPLVRSRSLDEDVLQIIERLDLTHIRKDIHFFYPYEIQIMDQHSYEENEKGRSAHSEYRKAQIQTAMKRIMGALMNAVR